jgi:hypothetical protein
VADEDRDTPKDAGGWEGRIHRPNFASKPLPPRERDGQLEFVIRAAARRSRAEHANTLSPTLSRCRQQGLWVPIRREVPSSEIS